MIHDFEYVPKVEWEPVRKELYEIIHRLQDEVRKYFTFQYHFIGSSQRNMITRDRKSNVGYDFDVNIEINDPNKNYSAEEIRNIFRNALNKITNPYGLTVFGYNHTEDSTRVLTIKVKDTKRSRILHSCDFCIINNCCNGRQKYIRYNKKQNHYSWEYQPKGYANLPAKIEWIKQHRLWSRLRDTYLYMKNTNTDSNKHSRAIFAEAVNNVYHALQHR